MPTVDPLAFASSSNIPQIPQVSHQTDQDIWRDAIDHIEMEDTWFDTIDHVEIEDTWFDIDDEHDCDPSSSAAEAADSRVPFTEDCIRGVQQFIRTLGEYGENRMLSVCFSLLPGSSTNLLLATNSLYTAIRERRNIDAAALHTLGLASEYLPDDINLIRKIAAFIRNSIIDWTDAASLQHLYGENEDHTSSHLFTFLAVMAFVTGLWMKDRGSTQRRVLRAPAFMANIFIRANHYWAALENMARRIPSATVSPENIGTSQHAPALEVDNQVEMTGDVFKATVSGISAPSLTAFSSNSTANPEPPKISAQHYTLLLLRSILRWK